MYETNSISTVTSSWDTLGVARGCVFENTGPRLRYEAMA